MSHVWEDQPNSASGLLAPAATELTAQQFAAVNHWDAVIEKHP